MRLYGIMNFLNAKPGEISKCNDQAAYIVRSVQEVFASGKPMQCTGDFLRKGWRFQYNPEKGESPESELKKYLGSLPAFGIMCYYDERKDEYYFEKALTTKQ